MPPAGKSRANTGVEINAAATTAQAKVKIFIASSCPTYVRANLSSRERRRNCRVDAGRATAQRLTHGRAVQRMDGCIAASLAAGDGTLLEVWASPKSFRPKVPGTRPGMTMDEWSIRLLGGLRYLLYVGRVFEVDRRVQLEWV
ncbi:MAG: hypothetical protein ACREFB_19950, partial [Stellaceae bacterium]